ncbi:hypothetical protein G6F68_015401 [Rhizopus microsporus]|nr:hypothetical protein G6F68_015401 [Rhizopus microsporus]
MASMAAHEQQRQGSDRAGQDRQHGIAQHVPEQHDAFGQPLGARGAHVVLADFFQEQGAVEARLGPQPRHDRHQHRQRQELDNVQPTREAREWHQAHELGEDPLAGDDVEQAGDRQQQHAHHHAPEIQPRRPEIHQRE